jgi:hypothetical protein
MLGIAVNQAAAPDNDLRHIARKMDQYRTIEKSFSNKYYAIATVLL